MGSLVCGIRGSSSTAGRFRVGGIDGDVPVWGPAFAPAFSCPSFVCPFLPLPFRRPFLRHGYDRLLPFPSDAPWRLLSTSSVWSTSSPLGCSSMTSTKRVGSRSPGGIGPRGGGTTTSRCWNGSGLSGAEQCSSREPATSSSMASSRNLLTASAGFTPQQRRPLVSDRRHPSLGLSTGPTSSPARRA